VTSDHSESAQYHVLPKDDAEAVVDIMRASVGLPPVSDLHDNEGGKTHRITYRACGSMPSDTTTSPATAAYRRTLMANDNFIEDDEMVILPAAGDAETHSGGQEPHLGSVSHPATSFSASI
jgi:hypothetical protein